VLNQKSGLLGISGLSSDIRDILVGIQQGHERAKLAFDIYVHRLRAAIGSMAAVLGGVDAVVFTAGVGENSPEVRAAACSGLEFLGLRLDSKTNARPSLGSGGFYPGFTGAPGDSGAGRLGYRQRVLEAGASNRA
jgi:acetate kinase